MDTRKEAYYRALDGWLATLGHAEATDEPRYEWWGLTQRQATVVRQKVVMRYSLRWCCDALLATVG
jgi:hypothetical protein